MNLAQLSPKELDRALHLNQKRLNYTTKILADPTVPHEAKGKAQRMRRLTGEHLNLIFREYDRRGLPIEDHERK